MLDEFPQQSIAEQMGMKATLDFKVLRNDAVLPNTTKHGGDIGFDLTLTHLIEHRNGVELWGTGIAICPPTGLGALLMPRSSMPLKTGYTMANSVGVIDAGYRGEIMVPLVKINPYAPDLEQQEHRTLIQLVLFPATLGPGNIKMRLVDDFDHHTSRGDGGFGSTDRQ